MIVDPFYPTNEVVWVWWTIEILNSLSSPWGYGFSVRVSTIKSIAVLQPEQSEL